MAMVDTTAAAAGDLEMPGGLLKVFQQRPCLVRIAGCSCKAEHLQDIEILDYARIGKTDSVEFRFKYAAACPDCGVSIAGEGFAIRTVPPG